jgi:hypothetical protein
MAHSINLLLNLQPVKNRVKKYTQKEIDFTVIIFPEMEEAGILI